MSSGNSAYSSQKIELRLDGIAHGGEAFGSHGGRMIFVPFAIPGERVRVELLEEKPRWARARLLDVLEPSPDRVEPPCPYFGPEKCGGCQWQHIAYERQADLKQQILADQLRRLGRIAEPPVADIIALASQPVEDHAPEAEVLTFRYRNQTRFGMSPDGRLGYRRALAADVIPIDRCLLLHERLDDLHGALDLLWPSLTAVTLRAGIATGQALVLFETASDELPELEIDLPAACAVLTPHELQPLVGEPWVEEQIAGRLFRISAESFFEANTTGAEALAEVVAAYLEPRADDCLIDANCGVGLFTSMLADAVGQVIGIEPSPAACEDFAHNAGVPDHVSLHEGAVEDVLPALRAQGQQANLVVIDSPVSGAGPEVVGHLAAMQPRRIVYVSSDPAALARDSVHLAAAGYRLAEVQPIDMRPQTSHVKSVALWEKR
jgi:23S rRNA (uracil-5-)-methyltransferase RumA